MALILADRVKESTTTTGTSDFALGGAITGFQTFASAVGANNTTYYAVADGADWEVGLGTLSNDGLTLARTTVLQSSNSDTKVSFASGTKHLFVTYPADKAVSDITSTDASIVVSRTGSIIDLAVSEASPASTLLTAVRNTTGATLTKGTAVYISGASGQTATVSKALATGDSTSAQTLGLITSDLANNSNGYVTVIGLVSNINTSAYTDGAQLYLSPTTAGTLTATKPYAPNHLVYVAIVQHAHATQGKLFVKVQNGYEMDELHNVSAQSPTTGQTLVYNASTSLWEKNTVSLTAGVNGTLPVANGGTGITSFGSGVATFLGTPSSANLASAVTDETGTGALVFNTSPTFVTPILGTPTSGNFSTGTFTWPTFNQNTTGTAAGLSATLATTSGGTGLTSFTSGGVVYASSTSALATGSALTFNGTSLVAGERILVQNNGTITSGFGDGVAVGGWDSLGFLTTNTLVLGGYRASQWTGTAFYASATRMMDLTSTGLGIGTSSPAYKLQVVGGAISASRARSNTAGDMGLQIAPSDTTIQYGFRVDSNNNNLNLDYYTGSAYATRAVLDNAGNVGIGTTNPTSKLQVGTGAATSTVQAQFLGGVTVFENSGATTLVPTITFNNDLDTGFNSPAANTIGFYTAGAERARIDSSGNLLVGKTTTSLGTAGLQFIGGAGGSSITSDNTTTLALNRLTSDGDVLSFWRSTSQVGSVSVTTSATAYNTSSDYRLKNTIALMTGALAKVALLKPCTYKWNVDGSDGEGFIAHELAEVCPQAVSGEKDAVDADGNPKYQGIDTSFLVATLTAALQEQQAIIESLKARLDAANL